MQHIVMNTNTLDDESVVVNFDMIDGDGVAVMDGGYVHIRKQANSFSICIYNSSGEVVSDTMLPFNFKEHN